MKRQTFSGRRPGAISVITLIAVPILLLLVGLVVYVGLLRGAKTEAQTGADAAALAAARALATDALLTNNLALAQQRVADAQRDAVALARANFAVGKPLRLDLNPTNDADGDVVLGRLVHPTHEAFDPAGTDPRHWVGSHLNAVQVTVRGAQVRAPLGGPGVDREVAARAVGILDFRLVGFHPNDDLPISLMPIAVYTDHTGDSLAGWDHHTRGAAPDLDSIPKVTVVIGNRGTTAAAVPAVFLRIGVADFLPGTVEQIRAGIGRKQFPGGFGDGFVLGDDNILKMPGSPDCPADGDSRAILDKTLADVAAAGVPRIWPLFSAADHHGQVQVSGWMAARIVAVGRAEGGGIALTLQPAVVHLPAAVTEYRADPPAFWVNNRTVCRVRLAE